MATSLSAVFIPVHDLDAALVVYRDALDLEVRNDVSADAFRWVTVGAPGQDVDVVLSQPHAGRSPTEGDALLALVTQGSLQAAIFRAGDLDATFESARRAPRCCRSRCPSPGARATAPATRPASSASRRPDGRADCT